MINRCSARQFVSSFTAYLSGIYDKSVFAEDYRCLIKAILRITKQHENEMVVTFQQFNSKTKIVFYDLSNNVLGCLLVQKKNDLMFVSVIERGA